MSLPPHSIKEMEMEMGIVLDNIVGIMNSFVVECLEIGGDSLRRSKTSQFARAGVDHRFPNWKQRHRWMDHSISI
jgi:hypothetical protein